ncbi:MAG: alpha/beta hydrolase [Erythrobacter sp.]|jgi:pimeloyl-ACP methyl ester carboxylesterase|nr:alpha/beta hydrolase [Erythrobacter sp.]
MQDWHLEETHETSFGSIAAGRAGSGPPLLLAHGWPWSSYAWHRLIPALAERYTCHWYDMLGYGSSQMPADRPTGLDVQGELQAEMLEQWGIERPIVIAHDFGGATSLRAHLLHGVELERLVLMNVVAINPWGSDFFDHVGKHVDAFAGLPSHIHEAVVRAYIKGAMVREIDAEDFEALARPWLTGAGRTSFYRQFAMADEALTEVLVPLYEKVRCPVEILWGDRDPWIPIERGRKLHRSIPGSTFTELPGLGHLPQLEQPDTVLSSLPIV